MVSPIKLPECESVPDIRMDHLHTPVLMMGSDARRRSSGGSELGHERSLRSSSCRRSRRMFCLAVDKRTMFQRLNRRTLLGPSAVLVRRNISCHAILWSEIYTR